MYSLTGREVTESTVAAVLTVLGYSIYDTIIIFDRVRENIPIMRRASFATIANVSLWETIRRSLATTFITLLPVAALFFFGGATLKDFAFALLIGVTSGAYSSIFIAAPLLTLWKETRAGVRAPQGTGRRSQGRAAAPRRGRAGRSRRRADARDADRRDRRRRSQRSTDGRPDAKRERRGASAASHGPMAAPGSDPSDERDTLERLIASSGRGFDELGRSSTMSPSRWRGDAPRLAERTKRRMQELARELGLVTRDEWDELELRVAQLEHRLRLLEDAAANRHVRNPCYRGRYGTRMGRVPVRSRLLLRNAISTSEGVETSD